MNWPHSPTCTEDCPGHTPTMTPIQRVVKAIAIADAKWWDMIQANHGSGQGVPDQGHMQATAAIAALSADGPIIVIDGKVAVAAAVVGEWVGYDLDEREVADLIDAAREVTDRG